MTFGSLNLPAVRNVTCSLLLVALCSLFVPQPQIRTIEKDQSVAFPCQDRPCGCKTADDCWTNCCCFSDQEKLAWAKEHQVEPPKWFRPIAKSVQLAALDVQARSCSCCCECHSKKDASSPLTTTIHRRVDIVLQLAQQKCRGDIDYICSRIILDFNRPVINQVAASEPLWAEAQVICDLLKLAPPTPPPRRLLAS